MREKIGTPEDFLTVENVRNKDNAQLYVDMVKQALGSDWDVLIGHHIMYEKNGDVTTEGEIPSADTLIFDHTIMGSIFGDDLFPILQELAIVPPGMRDVRLAEIYEGYRK